MVSEAVTLEMQLVRESSETYSGTPSGAGEWRERLEQKVASGG